MELVRALPIFFLSACSFYLVIQSLVSQGVQFNCTKAVQIALVGHGVFFFLFGFVVLLKSYRIILPVLYVGSILWSIFGIIAASTYDCLHRETLLFLSVVVSSTGFICTALPMLLRMLYNHLLCLTPEDERSPLLIALRCSCWSRSTKKLLFLLPLAVLFLVSCILTMVHRHEFHQCDRPYGVYLVVCASLFAFLLLYSSWLFFTRGRIKTQSTFVLLSIIICSVLCTSWAIVGSLWLDSQCGSTQLTHAVAVLRTLLYILGICTMAMTFCCRTERFVVDEPEHETQTSV